MVPFAQDKDEVTAAPRVNAEGGRLHSTGIVGRLFPAACRVFSHCSPISTDRIAAP